MTHDKIMELVSQLTLEEKAGLTSGKDNWFTKAVERLGIPAVRTSDGPHGLRTQAGEQIGFMEGASAPAVCFPTACCAAASFDRELIYRMGEELGKEAQAYSVNVLLGPGVNIKRSPLCGRNFEYFSEDPLLAGELGAAYVQGVQSQGVGTSLKHFFANNQEYRRNDTSSELDERTMREIYLSAFETVVKKAQPWTVMASYNKINGIYSTANKGWKFDGGEVKADREANRLQVFFDEKPDRETCSAMRHGGFRWAPSVGAWQRQLNNAAVWTARHIDCLRPVAEETPTQIQVKPVPEPPRETGSGWGFYIVPDLKSWADNAEKRRPMTEYFPSFEAAKERFEELWGEDYNSEITAPDPDLHPPARLVLGIERTDGTDAADILHVRQGKNYFVDDSTHMERLCEDPAVVEILSRVYREIGFDVVSVHERTGDRSRITAIVPFSIWSNPYFPAATPGNIAAQYYTFLHECYPLPRDEDIRAAQIDEVIQYLQREGKTGADKLSQAIAGLAASLPDNPTVQNLASVLMAELAQYNEPGKADAQRQKPQRKRSQER